jgi:osmotically-inducible protein OsmY
MTISEDNLDRALRTNHVLQANIRDALRKEATVHSLDLGSLSIKQRNGEVWLHGYLKEENRPLMENTIHSVVGVVEVHNHLRTNEGILADICDALWREDTIRSVDLGSLSIAVKDGEVYLDGHLAQGNNRLRIESIVRSVAGVVAVHNNLVLDHDLIIRVARALATDERTRPYIFVVGASHGWIRVVGKVPTRELQHVAGRVAAEVSQARGVIALPRIPGDSPAIPHPSAQPRIGALVYGKDGEAGVVTQVVIQPDNRLVTDFVVRSGPVRDSHLAARETIIPLEASEVARDESIILQRKGPSLKTFPAFDPNAYPLAPSTWKAPYPYAAGEVRWPLRENVDAGSLPTSQPEIEPGIEPMSSDPLMAQAGP